MARSRSSSSSSSDGGPPEITCDALSADTLAALTAHLAVKDAAEVCIPTLYGVFYITAVQKTDYAAVDVCVGCSVTEVYTFMAYPVSRESVAMETLVLWASVCILLCRSIGSTCG